MEPQAFTYKGKIFQPHQKLAGGFDILSHSLWGNTNSKGAEKLDVYIKGFNHKEFYQVAKQNGADKFDTFMVEGEERLPCGGWLAFYNRPSSGLVNKIQLFDDIFYAKQNGIKKDLSNILVKLFKLKSLENSTSLMEQDFKVCEQNCWVAFVCGDVLLNGCLILNGRRDISDKNICYKLFKVGKNKHKQLEVERFLENIYMKYFID